MSMKWIMSIFFQFQELKKAFKGCNSKMLQKKDNVTENGLNSFFLNKVMISQTK